MKKKVKKFRVPRTRNGGTMTNSMFFTWLRNKLRRASMYWHPIAQVMKDAQVPYKGPNKRRKYSYECSECHGIFSRKSVKAHHIVECGQLNSFADLSGFAERLFVEKSGLRVLCNKCHDKLHGK